VQSFPDRATVIGAFLEGARRVLRAPAVTIGVAAATVLLAFPLSVAMRGVFSGSLDAGGIAARATWDWNAEWTAHFGAQGHDLARTFTHEIFGFGGTVATVGALLDGPGLNHAIASTVAAYLALWMFLSGGILDRLARARPIRTAAFFAACGVYFVRFFRLALLLAPVYWALFVWLHPFVFHTLSGRVSPAWSYTIFLAALAAVNLVSDYARVRMVVEDRHSAIGGVGAALRFIRRRPFRTFGLYMLSALAAAVVIRFWFSAAPGAGDSATWAFLVTQLYLLFRIWARLMWMAAEVVFFQGELAHATYTAAPLPVWPESPAAEALANLTRHR
jgi:hypothetical protein